MLISVLTAFIGCVGRLLIFSANHCILRVAVVAGPLVHPKNVDLVNFWLNLDVMAKLVHYVGECVSNFIVSYVCKRPLHNVGHGSD